ncbi:MAG: hypothetical protein II329_04850 [Clostridia bacterium]|nr:hypothetical protein [Clostridia bacterium]
MYKKLMRVFECDLSVYALIFGYIFGLVFSTSSGLLSTDSIPELSSVFLQKGAFSAFMQTSSEQVIYLTVIFLTGFIPFSSIMSSGILFIRAFLASYSCLLLALGSTSEALYILHTLSSVFTLCICFALSKCAYRYSSSGTRSTLSYALEFLFFTGIMFVLMFCRNIALAFV